MSGVSRARCRSARVYVRPGVGDLDAASNRSPWSTYAGEFPLAQTDNASNGEDAARSAWRPPTLQVRGSTERWVVAATDPDAPRLTRTVEVDAAGRCGIVVEDVALQDLRVVFVDERGAPLARHVMGAMGLEIGEHAATLGDDRASWESCLARSPDLQAAWSGE